MELSNRHVVVTGGAGAVGRALVRRIDAEGARVVVVADRELAPARYVAEQVEARATPTT